MGAGIGATDVPAVRSQLGTYANEALIQRLFEKLSQLKE